MRHWFLIVILFMPVSVWAQDAVNQPAQTQEKPVLIRDIRIEGFVLGDKERFVKLFKPYQDKYLSKADMDGILHQLQLMYEREGYQQLVSISYQVTRHRLVFTALMIS